MSVRRWMGRWVALMLLVGLSMPLGAQLKIIPRQKVEEAANPRVVEGKWMLFESDGNVSFGTIEEDCGSWHGKIRWRATQGKRLTITRIQSSCGCLAARWDKRKSTNATEGIVELEYRPKGHAGMVGQRLFVYTTLSDEHPTAIIKLSGNVEASVDPSGNYPFEMGVLRLRQRQVTLPGTGGKAHIAVFNSGSQSLRIEHDRGLTIGGVEAFTEPRILEPGAEGDLVVRYAPQEGEVTPPLLHLSGVDVPPRARKIEIEIKENK